MSFLDTGSVQLAWQQLGEGPDVVLVHGLATNRAFWYATLAQRLRQRYRVTLFDLRGHGYSSRPDAGYSVQAMAEDLAAVIDRLTLAPVAVVGHSYGGAVALEHALQQPDRLRAMVLMDTRVQTLQPHQWLNDCPHLTAFEEEMALADGRDWESEPQVGMAFLEAMARLRINGYQSTARDPFTPFAEGKGGLRSARAFCRLLDESKARDEFLAPGSDADAIARLPVPVQLLYGTHSRNLPSGHALAECLPRAQLTTMPEAGHFFPLSHAADVATLVEDFLQDAMELEA